MPAPQSPAKLFHLKKSRGEALAMLSLYDAPTAQLACDAGADVLLVGDSMGNVVLGHDTFLQATLDDIARGTEAVVRGVKLSSRPDVPVIADLPFATYVTPEHAVESAARLMRAGAAGVKLEGAGPRATSCVEALREAGVAVMGHIGYTPQSHFALRGVVQGRSVEDAHELLSAGERLQAAGACALLLEAVAEQVSQVITQRLTIATVGIGAGANCDGQVLVWHDLVGFSAAPPFRFVKRYAELRETALNATREFVREVHERSFPTDAHTYRMNPDDNQRFHREIS